MSPACTVSTSERVSVALDVVIVVRSPSHRARTRSPPERPPGLDTAKPLTEIQVVTDEQGAPGRVPLRLRFPEPAARPGQAPAFGGLRLDPAGEMPRPPIDTDPKDMLELGNGLVRVLDDEGEAVGPWAGTLDVAA